MATVDDDEVQLHVVLPAVCTVSQPDTPPYDPECFVTEADDQGTFTVALNAETLGTTEREIRTRYGSEYHFKQHGEGRKS